MLGDAIVPFDSVTLNNIDANQRIPVSVKWNAKEGIDRIRVVVDPDDVIVEVNDDDNTAEHKVEIVYVSYMGWFDSIREQPLIWLFSILSIIVLVAIGITANRTAISHGDESLFKKNGTKRKNGKRMTTKNTKMMTTITTRITEPQIVALLNQ